MKVLWIYSSEELMAVLAMRGASLRRLADNVRLEVASDDDKTPAATLLFEGGNTCVQVETAN